MKKATLNAGVTPQPTEIDFLRAPPNPLTLEERTALRTFFASTAFRRAYHNIKLQEPSCLPPGDLSGPAGGAIANNRLHQQQGWKMFEAALLRQCSDPIPPREQPQEKWSEAGMEIVSEKNIPPVKLAPIPVRKPK